LSKFFQQLSSKVQVIAKSSRLERGVLRVLWICWALMPCHLSC